MIIIRDFLIIINFQDLKLSMEKVEQPVITGRITRNRARLLNIDIEPVRFFSDKPKKRKPSRNTDEVQSDEPAPKKRKTETAGSQSSIAEIAKQKNQKTLSKAKSGQPINKADGNGVHEKQIELEKANSKDNVKTIKPHVIVISNASSVIAVDDVGVANSENQIVVPSSGSDQNHCMNTVAKIEFKVGEIVWAKIKGWPTWPAQIKCFPSAKMAEIVWCNDYRKTRLYRTQMFKFLPNFDKFAVKFDTTVGLETAAKEGLIRYGEFIGAPMRF